MNSPRASFVDGIELAMPEMPAVNVSAMVLMFVLFLAILTAWIGVVLRLAFGLPVLPPRTPRYVPWGVGSVVFAVLGWLGLQIFVPTVYLLTAYPRGVGVARHELTPSEQMALSAAINALILIVIPAGLALISGARLRDFGIVAAGFAQNVFRGIVAYPLLAPLVFGVMIGSLLIWNKTPHPLENALKFGQNPGMIAVLVLAAVVFAPLSEELLFRGVLLGWLTRLVIGRPKAAKNDGLLEEPETSSLGDPFPPDPGFDVGLDRDPLNPYAAPLAKIEPVEPTEFSTSTTKSGLLILANVVVSLIFAALHAGAWPTPIPIFFLSLGLGVLYQRTGSLIPSMALHMTFNGVSTVLMLLTLSGPAPKPEAKPPEALKAEVKAAALIDFNFFPDRAH